MKSRQRLKWGGITFAKIPKTPADTFRKDITDAISGSITWKEVCKETSFIQGAGLFSSITKDLTWDCFPHFTLHTSRTQACG